MSAMVRVIGVEPPQAFQPYGFSDQLRLSPLPSGVCGLGFAFTLASVLGAAMVAGNACQPTRYRLHRHDITI
jgi:hypothetical protein